MMELEIKKHEHIFTAVHWLPVHFTTQLKTLLIISNPLIGQTRCYITGLCVFSPLLFIVVSLFLTLHLNVLLCSTLVSLKLC